MAKKRVAVPKLEPEVADRGRPTAHNVDIADQICTRLAAGESLRAICEDESMPCESAVRAWALDDRGGFYAQYDRARKIQALRWADEIIEIADTPEEGVTVKENDKGTETRTGDMIEHRRLRVSSRQWMLSRMLPKVYGDKQTTELTGPNGGPLQVLTGSVVVDIKDLGERARNQLRGILLAAKAKEQ